jgi:hypothetical protein
MTRLRISPLALAALILMAALNISGLVWLVRVLERDAGVDVAPAGWTRVEAAASGKTAAAQKPPGHYAETLSRPVFSKDRRSYSLPPPPPPVVVIAPPPPAPPPPPPPPPPPDPEFVLGGVAITAEFRRAYLVPKSNAEGIWVNEGEQIAGWQVSAITEAAVEIHSAGRTKQLLLFERQ